MSIYFHYFAIIIISLIVLIVIKLIYKIKGYSFCPFQETIHIKSFIWQHHIHVLDLEYIITEVFKSELLFLSYSHIFNTPFDTYCNISLYKLYIMKRTLKLILISAIVNEYKKYSENSNYMYFHL